MNTKIEQIQNNVKTLLDCYVERGGKLVENDERQVQYLATFFTHAIESINKNGCPDYITMMSGQYFCKNGLGKKQDWFRQDNIVMGKSWDYCKKEPLFIIQIRLGNFGDEINDYEAPEMVLKYNYEAKDGIEMQFLIGEAIMIYIDEEGKAKIALA